MKIVGKNSLSKYLSYLLFFVFVICLLHFIYHVIGHSILLYKHQSGSQIFSNTFILSKDVGWTQNKWTIPMNDVLKFKINYPFTQVQAVTGVYGILQIFNNTIGMLFITLFFFFSYKSLKEMSSEKLFNAQAIKWLKRFGYLNLLVGLFSIVEMVAFRSVKGSAFLQFFFLGFLGLMVLFIVQFFKKGYELQSEIDLTI